MYTRIRGECLNYSLLYTHIMMFSTTTLRITRAPARFQHLISHPKFIFYRPKSSIPMPVLPDYPEASCVLYYDPMANEISIGEIDDAKVAWMNIYNERCRLMGEYHAQVGAEIKMERGSGSVTPKKVILKSNYEA